MRRLALLTRDQTIVLPALLAMAGAAAAAWFLPSSPTLDMLTGGQGALVGQALLGSAGKLDAGKLLASYPPVALLPLITLQSLTGLPGAAVAKMLTALLGLTLGSAWLRQMLLAGFRPVVATIITLLLILNPLFLRAFAEGLGPMLVLAGAWLFAASAFTVRGRGNVNDLMLCSGSLILLVFTGQAGMLVAVATVPFLWLVLPADIRARSWASVYLVLLFPVLFALLGFMLVNWMMLADPLAFLRPQIEASGSWFAGSWEVAAAEIVSAVACTPILVGLFVWSHGRRPLQSVTLALLGTVMTTALLALQTGIGLSLTAALSPAIGVAAAAAMRWPAQDYREMRATLLLALGVLGSGSALLAQQYTITSGSQIRADRRDAQDRALGRFLRGRSAVMIDAAAHPQVVAGRGSAEGLITASETAFELSMLRRRIAGAARLVAVAEPNPARNADTIGRILPGSYRDGLPGFRLVYDQPGWRVWSRDAKGNTP